VAQAPRELTPYRSPAHYFGAELRRLRMAAGLSQNRLGHEINYSGALIGKIEKGERWPQPDLVRRCDETLGAQGDLLATFAGQLRPLGDTSPSPTTGRARVLDHLPALRHALDARDLPADGPVRPLSELRRDVRQLVRWRLDSDYWQLAGSLPALLPELHRARQLSHSGAEELLLLAQAYRAADAIADKFGMYDLSARIVDLMVSVADVAGDELTVAAAAYVRGETFFATRDWTTGRRLLARAAARLSPAASAQTAAAYGALHMRTAIMAARAGDPAAAEDHINEAVDAARLTPEGIYHGTAFGPASVRIHRLALSVDARDIGAALSTAAGWWPPASVPAERRSHFFVELARAHLYAGDAGSAAECLHTARRIAPLHVRHDPDVKSAVQALLRCTTGPPTPLLKLARWTGLSGPVGTADREAPATS
jgi:transcriptional regulator with XRE-family HTH domain